MFEQYSAISSTYICKYIEVTVSIHFQFPCLIFINLIPYFNAVLHATYLQPQTLMMFTACDVTAPFC